MSDIPPIAAAPAAAPDKPPSDGQLVTAMTIVCVMGALGLALIIAGVISLLNGHPENAIWLGIGTVVGSLGTALNAPTGVATVIKAAGKAADQ